jgi:Ca2+-binding EF-hand superfamily protein
MLLRRPPDERPVKVNGGMNFKKDHNIIYGGFEYQNQQRRVRNVASKFMNDLGPDEKSAEKNRQRQLVKHKSMMREAGRMFEKADKDKDGELDFQEFFELCVLQARLRRRATFAAAGGVGKMPEEKKAWKRQLPLPTRRMLMDWFHVIDFDHSGNVSMTEFFVFSLREALAQAVTDGHGIDSFLSVWELNTTDRVERTTFRRVAAALGVDAVTDDILDQCKPFEDENGTLPIANVIKLLKKVSEGEGAKVFLESAAEVAQRPLDSLVGRKGGCTGKGQLKGPDTRSTRHRNSGPQIDAATSLAITMALQKVDLSGRSNALYDSRDAEVRAKEDVAPAMSILRSWIRKQGLRPLDIFQSWDHSQDYALTRKELRAGLAQFGLRLSKDLVTLIFDDIAAGFHMTYDELRDWLEGTAKAENLTEEERQWQAAKIIQKYIRARLVKLAAKKAAAT